MELEQEQQGIHYQNGSNDQHQNMLFQNNEESNSFFCSSINYQTSELTSNQYSNNEQYQGCYENKYYDDQYIQEKQFEYDVNNYFNQPNDCQDEQCQINNQQLYHQQQLQVQQNMQQNNQYQDNYCNQQNQIYSQQNSTINSTNSLSSPHSGFEIYHKQYSFEIDEEEEQNQSQQSVQQQYENNNNKENLKVVEFGVQLLKPVLERSNYYLIGDIAIDFELLRGKESRFSPLSEFRPIQAVQRNIFSEFIEIQLGQYQQGIKDFRFVVDKLNSMNDQFAHGIAVLLQKYQKLIDFKIKMQNATTNMNSSANQFNPQPLWEEAQEKIKDILIQKRKEHKYLAYIVKKGSYLEDIMVTQGVSESLLEVLGLDYETFRQISLRKGLIDFVEPISRYFIIVEQFANVAQKKMPWDDISLISIDNFKIPVKVKAEKITLNKYKCYENQMAFVIIDISQKVLDELKIKRYRARNMLENKNYFKLGEELTYSFETELFLDRYYSQQKAQAIIEYTENQQKKKQEENIEVAKVIQQYIQQYNQSNKKNESNLQKSVSSHISEGAQSSVSTTVDLIEMGQSIYSSSSLNSQQSFINNLNNSTNSQFNQGFLTNNYKKQELILLD